MNPSQDFKRLYSDLSDSIAAAMTDIAGIKVEHKDGKQELSDIMERLRQIQASFDGELDLLKQHSEWDRFTIAFFGETNAGKSTIIESLRILFNEDSRRQLLEQNAKDLVKYEQALNGHVNQVREALSRTYVEHAAEIMAIKQSTSSLARVLQEESSTRMRLKLSLSAIGGVFVGSVVVGAIVILSGRLI